MEYLRSPPMAHEGQHEDKTIFGSDLHQPSDEDQTGAECNDNNQLSTMKAMVILRRCRDFPAAAWPSFSPAWRKA